MALFMEVHTLEGGVTATGVAGAHEKNYRWYWVDEEAGLIFCLIEAPSAEAADEVHREAHERIADEIYPH